MTIASPANGAAVVASQPYAISGSGVGVTGTAVSASTMLWELSNGVATSTIASQTATFNYTFNETGEYVLTLTGKDSANKTGTTQARFTVNATPSAEITMPASGTRYDLAAEITFDANLTDRPGEESYLIASWASSIDGHMASGVPPLNYSDLSAGSHVITCEAINTRSKLSTSTSTMILVNTLPVGTLTFDLTEQYATAPEGIPVFLSTNSAMNITMTMTATDTEDGALTGASIEWFLKDGNNEIALATGKDVTRAFSPGLHNVVVRVYDSFRPDFEDQASATYNTSFYVWQSRILALADTDITYMHGEAYNLHMTRSGATKQVKEYKVETGLNPYFSEIASSSLASFTTLASASVLYDSDKYLTLGVAGGNNRLSTDSANLYDLGAGKLDGAISVAYSGDLTMAYLACNTRLTKFNPANGVFEEDITTAAGKVFNGLYRIRVADGEVFAADTLNDRIVRYLEPSLASPIVTAATAPTDVAVVKLTNGAYVMSLSNITGVNPVTDAGKISINLVTDSGSTFLMRFGDGTSSNAGKLNVPLAVHYNTGDLFILEKPGVNFQIHMIRSGMSNWLSGSKLAL